MSSKPIEVDDGNIVVFMNEMEEDNGNCEGVTKDAVGTKIVFLFPLLKMKHDILI